MRRVLTLFAVAALAVGACSGNQGASQTPGASGTQASSSPAATTATTFDPTTVSGTVVFSGWQASPEEGAILTKLFADFTTKYPNIKVDYQPVATDYGAAMTAKFSSGEPPDLFYVDSSVAPEWIDEQVLEDLEPMAAERGFDTSPFFPGYLDAFRGKDGGIFGFPKDGNTLGMAYNTDLLTAAGITAPPKNWTELADAATKLTTGEQKGLCLNNSLDRALAFIYQNGGSLFNEEKTEATFDSPETKEALTTYLGWFASGQGDTGANLVGDWCGKALGEKSAAIIFEGGWLDPYMRQNYPDVKYAWAPMPEGKEKATLGFTVSYSIGVDSKNKDAAWVLLTYLTGPEGMKTWTEGGVANPSRTDVAAAAGKEVLVDGAAYARPWSFIAGFSSVNDAFNNAMSAQIEAKSSDPTPVIEATQSAAEAALAQ